MARSVKFLKIGKQNYKLRNDIPITKKRKEMLQKHPQSQCFYFKKVGGLYWWYVKNASAGGGFSITQKEQNKILVDSYKKVLNKKDEIDNFTKWD